MLRPLLPFVPVVLLVATALPAFTAAEPERPRVEAVATRAPLHVDGILDEPDWARAEPITDFRLILQREGERPVDSTTVRVLRDGDRIVFGIRCAHADGEDVRSSLAPRDQITDDDHISVHLDTFLDRRRAYIFGVNAHGVQLDGILDGEDPDFTWDGVWQAETRREDGAWTAEIAVPFRTLRFPAGGEGVWGLWIRRQSTRHDEVSTWPLYRLEVQGDIMLQGADLGGLAGAAGSGGLSVQPYVASTHVSTRDAAGTPWADERDTEGGVDVEFSPTPAFRANVTVNPDYSQVEADALQIDVNRRFPIFYPEKRPFFLEGAEIFRTPLQLVHTRRIANPDFGAKIAGKSGRLRIGAIAARDAGGASLGGTHYPGPERAGDVGIARLTADVGANSNVGVVGTVRSFENEGVALPAAIGANAADGGRSWTAAGDARLQLGRRVFFTGQLAWSGTEVDSALGDDPYRLSDVGYTAHLRYGDGVRNLELYQDYLGPDFVAATGFLQRVDARKTGFNSNFYVRPESAWLHSWQPILNAYAIHDHDGGLEEWYASPMVDWRFQQQTHMHTMYVRSMERWIGRDYDRNTYIFFLDNERWRSLAVDFGVVVGDGVWYGDTDAESFLGWSEEYELELTARPSPRLTIEGVVERERFSTRRGGEELFDVWVFGANTTFQFTRRLYARVYPQYDSGREHIDADILLGYVVSPGRVFYLGMNRNYDDLDGRTRTTERALFLKASYLFQP